ncbi:MAG: hypothetical protein R8M45_08285 [Ghiorsea sp.]
MAYSVNTPAAEATIDMMLAGFQTGGVIKLYAGTREADSVADASLISLPLATVLLGVNAFDAAGTTAPRQSHLIAAINDLTGDANGTATWFRMYDHATPSLSTGWLSGDVGIVGSGADMELNDTAGGTAITTADKVIIQTFWIGL